MTDTEMCSFTDCNHNITVLHHALFPSISSLDYLLWKQIIPYQCISWDDWICTVMIAVISNQKSKKSRTYLPSPSSGHCGNP